MLKLNSEVSTNIQNIQILEVIKIMHNYIIHFASIFPVDCHGFK